MSEAPIDPRLVDQTRREIGRLVSEIEHLAGSDVSPAEFYAETMRRVYTALAARSVALWIRTHQGNLQLQFQVNLPPFDEATRPPHDELLRYIVSKQDAFLVAPHSGPGQSGESSESGESATIQNPTPFLLVLAPIIVDGETLGVCEVFQDASRRSTAQQGYVQFLKRVASEIAKFIKNGRYKIILNQQAQWNQVEGFIRSVHGGLDPTQVAYLVANEGKKLIQCERLSVAIQRGTKSKIVAISGQDVVEQRSNLIRRLTTLATKVTRHGENLVYSGQIEPHWPGDIQNALKEYVEESGSKLIIVVPMTDTRDFADRKGKTTSALLCEMIEDPAPVDEMAAKVEVVSRHGAIALANALEHDDVFLLGLWKGIGRSTRWMRGRGLPKVVAVLALLAGVGTFLWLFPYPLRLEGRGELVPEIRRIVAAPVDGEVRAVKVKHGDLTEETTPVAMMASIELEKQQAEIRGEIRRLEFQLKELERQRVDAGKLDPELDTQTADVRLKLLNLREREQLLAPELEKLVVKSPIRGTVTTWDPELMQGRQIKQGDPILEISNVDGKWVVEVDLPENAMIHIARAEAISNDKLPVEFVLSSNPDTVYKGRLIQVGTQASPIEQENFVKAKVEIEEDQGLVQTAREAAKEIQNSAKVSGLEVRAKINCGPKPLGYVLFRELIDFVREYVFF
jgi:multidrug efflux pump subunit AcrA (membrane-fusion protein)